LPAFTFPRNASSLSASYLRRFVLICLLLACTLSVIFSLETVGLAQEPVDEVLRVNTDLLVFPIRVRDKRKQSVATLAESDLTLKDEDRVTAGLYLYHGTDRVALIFALDQSGSTRDIIFQQRDAALKLFARFNERSRVAVLHFAESPSLVAPFGRQTSSVREAFNSGAGIDRRTAIFDAASAALNAFDSLSRVRSERRIVILISDGLDNASSTKAASVIEAAIEKRVSFYVIHLPLFEPRDGRLAVRSPAKGFRDLAEKTGGKYFLVGDAASALAARKDYDLTPVFEAIEDDLKSQYLLGFYLGESANDGRKHRFSLSLPPGFEYQVGHFGYSRKHDFFVDRPRQAVKVPD
jgi:VWFA-related protein